MNSSKYVLPELEEAKNSIDHLETATAELSLQWFGHHLLLVQLEETTFHVQEILQSIYCDESLQSLSNPHSAFC